MRKDAKGKTRRNTAKARCFAVNYPAPDSFHTFSYGPVDIWASYAACRIAAVALMPAPVCGFSWDTSFFTFFGCRRVTWNRVRAGRVAHISLRAVISLSVRRRGVELPAGRAPVSAPLNGPAHGVAAAAVWLRTIWLCSPPWVSLSVYLGHSLAYRDVSYFVRGPYGVI